MKMEAVCGDVGVRALCDAVRVRGGADDGGLAEIIVKEAFDFLEFAVADCSDEDDDSHDAAMSPFCSAGCIVQLICTCLETRPQLVAKNVGCPILFS